MRSAITVAEDALAAGAAQKVAELSWAIQVVRKHEPKTVLEIGTMKGGTLAAWCECAADDALIVSVDLPGGEWGGGYTDADVDRLLGYAIKDQKILLIRGDSHNDEIRVDVERALDLWPVDFLFIDGDHTYEGVKQDFNDYAPLVAKGGLIGFHDIAHHPAVPRCEVERFWEEIKGDYEHWEKKVDGDERGWGPWAGIGILRIP